MAKTDPANVIDAYRRRQGRKSLFTFADVSKALLLLFILASSPLLEFNQGMHNLIVLLPDNKNVELDWLRFE